MSQGSFPKRPSLNASFSELPRLPGSILWNLAWLGILTLYNNNDSNNNYHVLGVYYMLLTVLYIHQVMQFLQPFFKRDSINLIYTRGNKDLEKPNNLLKDKVSLLSRFRITTRGLSDSIAFVLNHCITSLASMSHLILKQQKQNLSLFLYHLLSNRVLCFPWMEESWLGHLCIASCIWHGVWQIGRSQHVLEGMGR